MRSRQDRIIQVIQEKLAPAHLQVVNESHQHSVPKNSETHFNIFVVSESFSGVQRVARQRMVFDLLKSELTSGLHAVTLKAITPEEWQAQAGPQDSPLCHTKK